VTISFHDVPSKFGMCSCSLSMHSHVAQHCRVEIFLAIPPICLCHWHCLHDTKLYRASVCRTNPVRHTGFYQLPLQLVDTAEAGVVRLPSILMFNWFVPFGRASCAVLRSTPIPRPASAAG
jgi:hypothetical protein